VEEGKIQEHDSDDHRNRLQDPAEDIPSEGIGAQTNIPKETLNGTENCQLQNEKFKFNRLRNNPDRLLLSRKRQSRRRPCESREPVFDDGFPASSAGQALLPQE
jgi:hypothetical protein